MHPDFNECIGCEFAEIWYQHLQYNGITHQSYNDQLDNQELNAGAKRCDYYRFEPIVTSNFSEDNMALKALKF